MNAHPAQPIRIHDLRDRLVRWANINSGSGNLPGLERMRASLATEFATLPGATVDALPLEATRAQVLRIRVRPDAALRVLLSGHYDTVYDTDHAFQQCTLLDEHRLRGPGVIDMKGGLVTMLAALHDFETSPHAATLGYDILLTPDEETGSVASRPVLEMAARNGRFAFALVFEPARSNGNLVKSRKGTGIFTLTCRGRAAHAGRDPEKGRNAIIALAEYLPQVDALNRELDDVLLNVGTIRGGSAVNIVPDFASAELNVRISKTADASHVLHRLQELATPFNQREGYHLEINGRFNRPPKETTPVEEQLFLAWQRCARDLGVNVSWQDVAGGSDGNLLAAAGLSTLDGLGPVGDHPHSPEEFVHLASLAERAVITSRFLQQIACGEIPLPTSRPSRRCAPEVERVVPNALGLRGES